MRIKKPYATGVNTMTTIIWLLVIIECLVYAALQPIDDKDDDIWSSGV